MASESSERRPVAVTLPPSLDEWLTERADTAGIDREELLVQLAATYRAAAEDGDAASELVTAVEEAATEAATERVEDRLGSFRSSLDAQLQAIRRRVVQLKHESDEKAEASRVSELSTRMGDLDGRLDGLEDAVGDLQGEIADMGGGDDPTATEAAPTGDADSGGHGGAADPEAAARLDDVESKLVRVARAVVELRDGHGPASDGDSGDRRTLRELRHAAIREGVREARCADCDGPIDLSLLPDATCPHCESRFTGLAVASDEPRIEVGTGDDVEDGTDGTDHDGNGGGTAAGSDVDTERGTGTEVTDR
jgi:hypothetical protein